MSDGYIGRIIMSHNGVLGTVLERDNIDGLYYKVAWYRKDGVYINNSAHYTVINSFLENLNNKSR
jgi:hypothetical protein